MKFILYLLIFLTSTIVSAQSIKIGYVNIDHVVTSSPQFILANQEVVKEFKPKEQELVSLASKIKQQVNNFNKDKDNNSKEINNKKLQKIAKLETKLKQKALIIKKQLQARNEKEINKIQSLINQVISQIAKDENYDLILYQEVAYASKSINISNKIVSKLRELFE